MNLDIIDKLVRAMEREELDSIVLMSPENFAYTTGFIVPSQPILRWRHAAVVVTRDGRSSLLAVDMEATTVRDREPGTDLRVWAEFEGNAMPVLAGLLRDLGLGSSRIGIETGYMPARDAEELRRLLPSARWETVDGLLDRMRMVKTPRELDVLRRVSRITDAAIQEAFKSVKTGDTEMDLAGAVTAALYRLGAEHFKLLIVATGERSRLPNVGPTDRKLRRGDLIRLEVFGVLQGYHAGVCRTGAVQEPSAEAERIWVNFVGCRDLLSERIHRGASSAQVYRDFLNKFGELGYDPISFVGHGIGLFLHEEPYLGSVGDWTLEEGMVLGVEPLVYGPDFGLQMKDVVAVTADGAERLSDVTDTDSLLIVP